MGFKPPLSFEELKAIQDRNPDNEDVRRLLWEVKRLHSVVLRGYQLVKTIPPDVKGGAAGIVSWGMWCDIKDDPVVKEREAEQTDARPSDED